MEKKPERLRFNIDDELCLLREVINLNPFKDKEKWNDVCDVLFRLTKKQFSKRAVKYHVEYLIKLFSKEDWGNRKKSGQEEQYFEIESLLQEIRDLHSEFKERSTQKKANLNKTERLYLHDVEALSNCGAYLENAEESLKSRNWNVVTPQEDDLQNISKTEYSIDNSQEQEQERDCEESKIIIPTHARKNHEPSLEPTSVMEYVNNMQEKEYDLKWKTLELEERKIAIEEKKLLHEQMKIDISKAKIESEIREKEHNLKISEARLQADKYEREEYMKMNENLCSLLNKQQDLILSLLKKIPE